MRIGELARRAGVKASALRYYERIGLLPEPGREPSGYRRYAEADVERLRFVHSAGQLGLTLDEIGEILGASTPGRINCAHVVDRSEKIEAFRTVVEDLLVEGLATVEPIDIWVYRGRPGGTPDGG